MKLKVSWFNTEKSKSKNHTTSKPFKKTIKKPRLLIEKPGFNTHLAELPDQLFGSTISGQLSTTRLVDCPGLPKTAQHSNNT